MTTQNLTDWFNLSEQKPWEPGVYEVEFKSQIDGSNKIAKSFFDGKKFNFLSHAMYGFSAETAYEKRKERGGGKNVIRWRGLSSDPNAKPAPAPKPKARGNRKVTRYVVMALYTRYGYGHPIAVFEDKEKAFDYKEKETAMNFYPLEVKKIRFRTPEAD